MNIFNKCFFIYWAIAFVLLGVCLWVFIENKYTALPKFKHCDIIKYLKKNNFQYTFVNQDSCVIDFESILKDKVVLADFFFTRCTSVCPRVTNALKAVCGSLRPEEHQKVVFCSYSVDPENDIPSELTIYRKRNDISTPNWTHITGQKSSMYRLIRDEFLLTVAPISKEEDDFIHSSQIVLLDKQQNIRGYYDGTDTAQISVLIQHIRKLL